jgi:hypothetical protein
VERSFFPLDEELALLPGSLTPYVHESLVRMGTWMPFKFAAELLEDLIRVKVSKSRAVRLTEAAGRAYVALQTEEADKIEKEAPPATSGCDKMVISADGAMVPLLHGEWAEVKTLVIGEVPPAVLERGEWVVHTEKLSYFSRLTNSEQFEHLTLSEIHRRGVDNSREVAAVTDGAEWLQSFVDYHCPKAVRILDFPHAGQRIGQIAEAAWGQASAEARQWKGEQLHQLKHQGPTEVLTKIRTLQEQYPEIGIIQENLAYLEKRQALMQYPSFQQQGWPIGSGIVESGNKLVVEARLKGAGMHWKRENVDPVLALRNIVCSDRWPRAWPQIENRLRQQAAERRRALRLKHRQSKELAFPFDITHPDIEISTSELASPQTFDTSDITLQVTDLLPVKTERWRPPADHPWRRFRYGHSLYDPSSHAKK